MNEQMPWSTSSTIGAHEEDGAPYVGLNDDEKVQAYKSIVRVDERLGGLTDSREDALEVVMGLHQYRQFKEGFGPQHPLKRILGAVVKIGIDYFAANPQLIEGSAPSPERKLLSAFVANLDDISFSEGTPEQIVAGLFRSTLETLNQNVALVDDNERVQALVGGITNELIDDLEALEDQTAIIKRENLIKRAFSSILRGGAAAFTENIDLFIPKDSTTKTLVEATLKQVVEGIKGKENLFTNESLELIFKSALRAVGESAELFVDEKILQDLIANTVKALTNAEGGRLFSEDTVAAIVQGALEAVRDNVETLIDVSQPQKQLLANIVRSVAAGLSSNLAGGSEIKSLLSKTSWSN